MKAFTERLFSFFTFSGFLLSSCFIGLFTANTYSYAQHHVATGLINQFTTVKGLLEICIRNFFNNHLKTKTQ